MRACVCDWEYGVGVWFGWFRRLAVGIGVCGVWVRMCVRWHAGRDGMGWMSPACCVAAAMAREHGVVDGVCVRGCM
jgi:hypothetical protein